MDQQIQSINQPNYQKIYFDIIRMKYPEKYKDCQTILARKKLSVLDIIKVNSIIFPNQRKENLGFNQKHRSYNKEAILQILQYQKKHQLNNSQLANHFKLSRNTVAKWKELFSL